MATLTRRGALIKKECKVYEQVQKPVQVNQDIHKETDYEDIVNEKKKVVKKKDMSNMAIPKKVIISKKKEEEKPVSKRQQVLNNMEMERREKYREATIPTPIIEPEKDIQNKPVEEEMTLVHNIDISDIEIQFILDTMYTGIVNMECAGQNISRDDVDEMADILNSSLSPITKLGTILKIGLKNKKEV